VLYTMLYAIYSYRRSVCVCLSLHGTASKSRITKSSRLGVGCHKIRAFRDKILNRFTSERMRQKVVGLLSLKKS